MVLYTHEINISDFHPSKSGIKNLFSWQNETDNPQTPSHFGKL